MGSLIQRGVGVDTRIPGSASRDLRGRGMHSALECFTVNIPIQVFVCAMQALLKMLTPMLILVRSHLSVLSHSLIAPVECRMHSIATSSSLPHAFQLREGTRVAPTSRLDRNFRECRRRLLHEQITPAASIYRTFLAIPLTGRSFPAMKRLISCSLIA